MIDTHCHLNTEPLWSEREHWKHTLSLLDAVIVVGFDRISSERAMVLAQQNANVYAAIGFHPDSALEWNDEEEVVLGIDKVFDKELVGELVDFITSLARWWASPGQFEEYGELPKYQTLRSVLLVGSSQELQAPFDSHLKISAQLECIDEALETCSKIGMQVMQIDKTPGLLKRLADLRLKLTELRAFCEHRMPTMLRVEAITGGPDEVEIGEPARQLLMMSECLGRV